MTARRDRDGSAARAYVDLLGANVDAFYEKRISYEQFSEANRKLWAEIHAAPAAVETLVLALLRERLGVKP